MVTVIVENLAAWPAWPGIAHRPEIVRGRDADDPLFGQPGDLAPQLERLIIGVIDRDGQLILGQSPFVGQQTPGMGDRLLFEIVPERKVAEHLKKRVVPRRVADIVQIIVLAPGADAFLAGRGARRLAGFKPGEDVFERHHPGVDEHQRRIIIRHQRRGRHHGVAVVTEVVEEGSADFVR